MFYKISDFEKDWSYEKQATLKLLGNMTDSSLLQAVSPEGRSLGMIAWHITTSIGEMMDRTGLKTDAPAEDAPLPESADSIRSAYEKASESVLVQVLENWNDETLLAEDEMYGEKWLRGVTLEVLIRHQIHHRAQMTVLMRQAGLLVPGIYGPSKEEWSQFGMPAAK